MFNFLLKKILGSRILKLFSNNIPGILRELREKINLSNEWVIHIQNILVLIIPYLSISLFIYPKLSFEVFLKEVFALLCAYGAVFVWFIDKITAQTQHKVAIGVTACVAPIFFINNTFGVAIVEIFLLVLSEFLLIEYLRGCNLFSSMIPVYIICENEHDYEFAKSLSNKYKILELMLFSETTGKNAAFSALKSTEDIKKWLHKIRSIPFYPMPRRIMYFSQKPDVDVLVQVLEISSEFSIPIFRISKNNNSLNTIPVTLRDFETIALTPQEKAALSSSFKGKRVWIIYDGRGSVLDLIYSIQSAVASVNLTILCESEKLATELDRGLAARCANKNCKIKIMDLNLMCLQDSKPDILFYSLPVKSFSASDDNLKEAVIKNVLDTDKLIQFSQRLRIPFVFVLSSLEALNSSNWIGATQRLGEMMVQFADSKNRKLYTKFRAIRIPDSSSDLFGLSGTVASSIMSKGYVDINMTDSELSRVFHPKEILSPLLKIVSSSLKEYDQTHSVYTISPKNGIEVDKLIKIICGVFCLQKDVDVKVVYNRQSEVMELENFPNISESLEKTNITDVLSTKLPNTKPENYESKWSVEQINTMTTRELIAAVFQNLSEKLNG